MNHSLKTFAGLLLGAVAIVGCQREPVNPSYDPDTQTVTTKFVLNVNTGQDSGTKMTADAVQKADNFLGITNAKLLTFITNANSSTVAAGSSFVNDPTLTAGKIHDLGTLYSTAMITPGANNATNKSSSSNRILDLAIPTQTDAVLFYAKANNSNTNEAVQGSMTMHVTEKPQDTYFQMTARIGDKTDNYYQSARLIAKILNYVADAEVGAQTTDEEADGYTGLTALSWRELGHIYDRNHGLRTGTGRTLRALEEQLAVAYSTITTSVANTDYISAAANSVVAVISELDRMALAAMAATPNFKEEANAKRVAKNIHHRITLFFDSNNEYRFITPTSSSIKTAMTGMVGVSEDIWNSNDANTGYHLALADLNQFPCKGFKIPSGAAQLTVTLGDDDEFSYKIPNQALLNQVNRFQPSHYTYPAELAYYVNSALRVTDADDLEPSSYPNGTNSWDQASSWAADNWAFGRVLSTTQGVAVKNNINYGVALLKTSVAWKDKMDASSTALTYLEDNRYAKTNNTEANNRFYLNPGAGQKGAHFELTGVLVGGQVDKVNWQFLKFEGSDPHNHDQTTGDFPEEHTDFNYVVYDDHINGGTFDSTTQEMTGGAAVPTVTGKENYTLLFDNYDATKAADAQNPVYVALEFRNNGDAFWGKESIIPSGGTFYLLAQLVPDPDATFTWPTNYQIPPLNEDGTSKKIKRVFIQDFMTTAVFRIGQTTLQHAFVSVPNLASTQMSFGLSVDLSWQTGYSFDVELDKH